MPHRAALVLAFTLVSAVRAIPLDEISARNDIGDQADSTKFSGISLPKTASENTGERRGAVVSLGQLTAMEDNELSRIGGTALGENHPAFIELDSDNVGQGDNASSGNSSWLVY